MAALVCGLGGVARAELVRVQGELTVAGPVRGEVIVLGARSVLRCTPGHALEVFAKRLVIERRARLECAGGDVVVAAATMAFASRATLSIGSEGKSDWVRVVAGVVTGKPRFDVRAELADIGPEAPRSDLRRLARVRPGTMKVLSLLRYLGDGGSQPLPRTEAALRVSFPDSKWDASEEGRRRQGYLARLALDAAGRHVAVTSGADRKDGTHAKGLALDFVGPRTFRQRLETARRLSAALGKDGTVLVEEVDLTRRRGARLGFQCNALFFDGQLVRVTVGKRSKPNFARRKHRTPFHATGSHIHVAMNEGRAVPEGADVIAFDPGGRYVTSTSAAAERD